MKMIVGLGNPGREYAHTRHNIGFELVDYLSDRWKIPLTQSKFKGQYGTGVVNGEKVILVKPLTYMNASGECIVPFLQFYKLEKEDFVVVYDDLDMPPGKIRLRQKGSAGGHNGIRSLIGQMGDQVFNRIRIGIGRPEGRMPVTDFVLTGFHKEEIERMRDAIIRAADACEYWLENHFLNVMNKYNVQNNE